MKNLLRCLMLALSVAAGLGVAHAGSVGLTVTDKEGRPAPDVVVVVVVDAANKAAAQFAPATPSAPVVIEQFDLRFVPYLTVVPVGSTLRFVNRDGYDHHVRSTPSGPLGNTPAVASFELQLDPGQPAAAAPNDDYKSVAPARKRSGATSAEVKVDKPGAIGLSCHLHSPMRGQVDVSPSPWFGKTDANGSITIDGVPDGGAEVAVWRSDQLQDQPAVRVTVAGAQTKATAQLNFTPRRRRG